MIGRGVGGLALLALALALGSSGCNPFAPRVCTLIGCADGLRVSFDEPIAGPVTVTAILPGGGSRTLTCESASTCSFVEFEDFRPGEVTITVAAEGLFVARTYRPRYEPRYANGEDCGVTCVRAEVVIGVGDA
jgi:hypothetical protein